MIKRLLLTLSLLASGAHAAVDLTAKPASGSFTFNSSWTGANGAVEPTTYYHVDEGSGTTLNDLGAENADGTITGADWITDGSAAALDFVSANSDYVTNLAAWGIANTSSDWTAAVLISIDSGASNDTYFSLGNTAIGPTSGSQVYMSGGIGASTHVVNNRYHGGTTQSDAGGSYTATTWQLIWFRWTASTRTLKVYRDNGTEDTGISLVVTSGQQVPDAADGRLGAHATSGVDYRADARIAGVYIWKSTALTAAQMQDVCDWNGSNCEPWPFLTPSGSCPATCAGGRSARCITDISDASDPDNLLYGLSPAATANEDTVCYDPSSVLGDTVNVTAAGWPSIASGGSQLTDSFDYCIMDNGDPCGTDGTYEVTFQPTITSVTGIGTGQTTGTVTVTPAGPTEGTVQSVAISKTSYDTYGAPTHAQIRAGVDGNNANVAWGSEFTKSFLTTVSPGWTFSRTSDQTYTNSSGVFAVASSGTPAFEYGKGVLIEVSRSNLVKYSDDLSNAAWVATNVTKGSTSTTDIYGNANTKIEATASAANGTLLQSITASSGTSTYRVYLKRKTGTGNIDVTVNGGTGWTTCTVTASWGPCSVTATVTNPQVGIRIVTSGDAVYMAGSQLEWSQPYLTSQIPTTSASESRSVGALSRVWNFPRNNISGQIKGTMPIAPVAGMYLFEFTDSAAVRVYAALGTTNASLTKADGYSVATLRDITSLGLAAGSAFNVRFKLSSAGTFLWVNDLSVASSTTTDAKANVTAAPTMLYVGGHRAGGQTALIIESVTIWNEAKSDAFLEALQ